MKKITVITPSYNRAHTLSACYESLKKQTSNSFVWLVIDDGSTDKTKQLVSEWVQEQSSVIIRYFQKTNGGKASALNMAFDCLETEYACVLDSDDTLTPNAIEMALNELALYESVNECCGLMAFRHTPDGKVMGGREIPLSKHYSMIDKLNGVYHTELICFYKSALLKTHKFPQFPGEKFVSPQWLDFELSRNYYFVTSQHQFCICEYISDGLTMNKQKVIKKNPNGYTAVKRQSFEFSKSIKLIIKHGLMYDCGCLIAGDEHWLSNSPRKMWSIILMPLAWILYQKRYAHMKV